MAIAVSKKPEWCEKGKTTVDWGRSWSQAPAPERDNSLANCAGRGKFDHLTPQRQKFANVCWAGSRTCELPTRKVHKIVRQLCANLTQLADFSACVLIFAILTLLNILGSKKLSSMYMFTHTQLRNASYLGDGQGYAILFCTRIQYLSVKFAHGQTTQTFFSIFLKFILSTYSPSSRTHALSIIIAIISFSAEFRTIEWPEKKREAFSQNISR